MYLVAGIIVVVLLAMAYFSGKFSSLSLVKVILVAIFSVVFCMKYHSPQYLIWFTPLVCLCIADELYGILLFFFSQIISYIEFPLLFGVFYTNGEYMNPVGSSGWYFTLLFFIFEYAVLIALIFVAVKPTKAPILELLKRMTSGNH
jgi:hypothetical protein